MNPLNSFHGGVFDPSLEGGRAGAQLVLSGSGIKALVVDGQTLELAFANAKLELGGATGKMIFVKSPDGQRVFYCEEPGFGAALAAVADLSMRPAAEAILAKLQNQRRASVGLWLGLLGIVAGLAIATPFAFHWALQKGVAAVPHKIDKEVGDLAYKSMDLGGDKLKNAKVDAALATMLERLKAAVPKSDFDYRLQAIENDDQVNAFALPGGQMVVFSGLLKLADKPEQVIAVLAHEMAHVYKRHSMQRMGQSAGVVVAFQVILGDVGGLVLLARELLTMATINGYSRDHEAEADREAAEALHRAGIDPMALADFFRMMDAKQKSEAETLHEVTKSLSWISTHPDNDKRIADVTALAAKLGPVTIKPLDIDWPAVRQTLGQETPQEDKQK